MFTDNYQFQRAKYCNAACYQAGHAKQLETVPCGHCREPFERVAGARPKKFCSTKCRYRAATTGGPGGNEYVGHNGYVYVHVGPRKWMLKHRMVMESHLERPLKRNENVHHKNHDKTDNRIENLKVFGSNGAHVKHHHDEWKRAGVEAPWNRPDAVERRVKTRRIRMHRVL